MMESFCEAIVLGELLDTGDGFDSCMENRVSTLREEWMFLSNAIEMRALYVEELESF